MFSYDKQEQCIWFLSYRHSYVWCIYAASLFVCPFFAYFCHFWANLFSQKSIKWGIFSIGCLGFPNKCLGFQNKCLSFPNKCLSFPNKCLGFPNICLSFPNKPRVFPNMCLGFPNKCFSFSKWLLFNILCNLGVKKGIALNYRSKPFDKLRVTRFMNGDTIEIALRPSIWNLNFSPFLFILKFYNPKILKFPPRSSIWNLKFEIWNSQNLITCFGNHINKVVFRNNFDTQFFGFL